MARAWCGRDFEEEQARKSKVIAPLHARSRLHVRHGNWKTHALPGIGSISLEISLPMAGRYLLTCRRDVTVCECVCAHPSMDSMEKSAAGSLCAVIVVGVELLNVEEYTHNFDFDLDCIKSRHVSDDHDYDHDRCQC